MESKKIPHFNSEFDLRLFLLIARKTLLWAMLIINFFLFAAFLYLRYTPYVYQASTIVKLGTEDKANKILNIGSNYFEQNNNNGIASSVELIRSKVIMDKATQKLPLELSYYRKGSVLSIELYKNSPFTVEYVLNNNDVFGKAIIWCNYCLTMYLFHQKQKLIIG
jgi:tyrosine-protein kinase Etk/Wzc